MHLKIFALPGKLKFAAPIGLALLAALLFFTAQSAVERYAVVLAIVGVSAGGYLAAWSIATAGRIIARDGMLIDETLHRVSQVIERLEADPRTAAGGQEAMDAVRGIWGDRADEWLKKSDLN